MKFFLLKTKLFFIKETYTFGQIVVWTIYTSHIDHFTPHHTAFEQSATCLSIFLESLPGLIPFAILWHAGWTLEKANCMNKNYNYPTTIFRSIFTQVYKFLVVKIYILQFLLMNCSRSKWKNSKCSYKEASKFKHQYQKRDPLILNPSSGRHKLVVISPTVLLHFTKWYEGCSESSELYLVELSRDIFWRHSMHHSKKLPFTFKWC